MGRTRLSSGLGWGALGVEPIGLRRLRKILQADAQDQECDQDQRVGDGRHSLLSAAEPVSDDALP